jgi:hypothetical protein
LTVRVDASDALVQAIADRLAVDAREAGLTIKVQAPAGLAPRPDARVIRVHVPASSPDRALAAAADRLTSRDAANPAAAIQSQAPSLDVVYQAEQKLLDRSIVVPLVHLPEIYGLSDRVGTWNAASVRAAGAWNFADVWLRGGRP